MRISDWSSDVCSSDLLLGDVEADFTERGIVAVDADLLGQPDIVDGAGNLEVVGQAVDDIMLLDIMLLPLPEDAADEADARIGGGGDALFEEIAPICVDSLEIFVRVALIARIVVKIDRPTVHSVVKLRVIRNIAFESGFTAKIPNGDSRAPI